MKLIEETDCVKLNDHKGRAMLVCSQEPSEADATGLVVEWEMAREWFECALRPHEGWRQRSRRRTS